MNQQEVCVICHNTPGESFVNLGCCKQKCCVTCFVTWMRIGNTCPTCRHVHAPKPEKPKQQIIQPVQEPVRVNVTREALKRAVQACWKKDLYILKEVDDSGRKIAIALAKKMAAHVANVANGLE